MIPAGIQHGQTEFGKLNNEIVAIHNGVRVTIDQIPLLELSKVDEAMNAKVHAALDAMGINDVMERRIAFLKCNCGNFDFTPDLTTCSDTLKTEYVECSYRGDCAHEGLLCQPITVNGIRLTMSELKVASFIRKGFFDKEICLELEIAPDTLSTHKRNLQRKLGAMRKPEIATLSIKYGIS